jgi:hypothetical protein
MKDLRRINKNLKIDDAPAEIHIGYFVHASEL